MLWIALATVGGLYLLTAIVMYFMQSGMVYFPSRVIEADPRDIGLSFEDVNLTTEDGVSIHGWFIPADSSRATLLFCHGNGGNISHRLGLIRLFNDLNLSVFIFDYHGYGKSGGKPGEQQTYADAESAWRYLTEDRGINPETIIIFGRSLGGAVATWLATRRQPAAVITESSFTSIPDIGAHHYPFLPVRLLSRFSYDSKANIQKITVPVLIIHSSDDDIVPFSHGKRLFELANEPKYFLQISGSHNDGYFVSDQEYRRGLDSFLSRILRR